MIKRPGAKTKQKKCNKFGSNVSVLKKSFDLQNVIGLEKYLKGAPCKY